MNTVTQAPPKETAVRNIVTCSIATAVAEIATLPICALKTNFQTQNHPGKHFHKNAVHISITQSSIDIYKSRGIKGFYSASIPAVLSQVFSTAGKYTIYRWGTSNGLPTIVSSIGAGLVISVVTHPLDFMRIALQRNDLRQFKNFSNFNPKTLYRGYSKSLVKTIVGSSLFFPIYDFTKSNIDSPVIASMTSAAISTILIHPFDYVKTRNVAGLSWYQGLNPAKYFRGCSLNLLRIVPHFVIVMSLTEYLKTRSIN